MYSGVYVKHTRIVGLLTPRSRTLYAPAYRPTCTYGLTCAKLNLVIHTYSQPYKLIYERFFHEGKAPLIEH